MKWMTFIVLLTLIAGCSSTRSILLHRGESDVAWEKERFLNGVPITVQVPTHIRIDVVEHHYLGYVANDVGGTNVDWLDQDAIGVPIRTVKTELIKTAKIFTVDPKRPAAGTLNSTIDFAGENGQYFDKIAYKVDDQTIEAITGLIGNVAKQGLVGIPTSDKAGASIDAQMKRVEGIVASAFFSLDAPDVEPQISQFLDAHLNACHTCRVVPPGVVAPTRLPVILEEPCEHGAETQHCPTCNY